MGVGLISYVGYVFSKPRLRLRLQTETLETPRLRLHIGWLSGSNFIHDLQLLSLPHTQVPHYSSKRFNCSVNWLTVCFTVNHCNHTHTHTMGTFYMAYLECRGRSHRCEASCRLFNGNEFPGWGTSVAGPSHQTFGNVINLVSWPSKTVFRKNPKPFPTTSQSIWNTSFCVSPWELHPVFCNQLP